MSELLGFMEQLVQAHGGAVERDASGGRAQALMSDSLAEALGLPEPMVSLVATDGPSAAQGGEGGEGGDGGEEDLPVVPVGYGTEVLERAMDLASGGGPTAAVCMPQRSLGRSMEEVLERHFVTLNATFRPVGTWESWQDYWLWSFSTVAEADERREGVAHVAVSGRGAVVAGLAERLVAEAPGWQELGADASHGEARAGELTKLYPLAATAAQAELTIQARSFHRGVHRRLQRDAARIDTYFGDLHQEMEDEIRRRRLTGEARQIRREKQAQLQREVESKRSALRDKYRLRLQVQPFALLLARIPVLRCDLLVRRRKQEFRLEVDSNGLTGRLDPLACQACGAPTLELGFCDEALHRLCGSCLDDSDGRGRRNCPCCGGRRPPASPQAVARRAQLAADGPPTMKQPPTT